MIRVTQISLKPEEGEELLLPRLCRRLKVKEADIEGFRIVKKSIDARKKEELHLVYQLDVKLRANEGAVLKRLKPSQAHRVNETGYEPPRAGETPLLHRPVIAGTGPAGLFCGYLLAEAGYAPILLERGGPVREREQAVERFWKTGVLDPECNVQFGEGGAGTFSDGKLNTMVKDPAGRGRRVLELFASFGAGEEILYEQKPHIGTDVLKGVLENMRARILSMGGEFRFHTALQGLDLAGGALRGLFLSGGQYLPADRLVLAIGHSARDTFQMLYEAGLSMQPKAFAVGLRIEHPQKMIQTVQYGSHYGPLLPPASYKVTARAKDGRGVYSFCMCPGGCVVNASSEPGRLAVNGMSGRARDGRNANSAMIVTISPEDFGDGHPLSGVAFQRELEERAFLLGGGRIPIQLFGDFKLERATKDLGGVVPDTRGETAFADLRRLLPEYLNRALIEGITQCAKRLPGFDRYDAVLSGVESRTSSPLRILRDESLQSSVRGVYPCGEGAGYAGGITSAAMDGLKVAEELISRYAPARTE